VLYSRTRVWFRARAVLQFRRRCPAHSAVMSRPGAKFTNDFMTCHTTFFVVWQSYHKIYNSPNIYDNLMTKCCDHLFNIIRQLVALYIDRKTTLFTQNTMWKMCNCIETGVIASNKSNGPTYHVLGPPKLYICQHQSMQCTLKTFHCTCRTDSHNYFGFPNWLMLNDWAWFRVID